MWWSNPVAFTIDACHTHTRTHTHTHTATPRPSNTCSSTGGRGGVPRVADASAVSGGGSRPARLIRVHVQSRAAAATRCCCCGRCCRCCCRCLVRGPKATMRLSSRGGEQRRGPQGALGRSRGQVGPCGEVSRGWRRLQLHQHPIRRRRRPRQRRGGRGGCRWAVGPVPGVERHGLEDVKAHIALAVHHLHADKGGV